jgi:putative glycosyltransferase
MRLSVVTTLYRSARHLREFHRRASAASRGLTDDYEIILVNDGSPDESLDLALALQAADPRIRVIDLSRNFGHHQAMWTGLRHACGEQVFLIDCDLEESPEWLERFEKERAAAGADVVFGVQEARGGSWVQRWGGWLFYKLFNALSDCPLPENLMTVRLMSRRYVDALLQHPEVSFTIAGLWARTGFLQVPVAVPKQPRPGTTYSLFRRARMFVHALTGFSNKPLTSVFYLGAAILMVSALVAGVLTLQWLLFGLQAGWPSLMVSIWMMGGLILFCQGIQGIYLAKIYLEAKRRPVAIVRQVHEARSEVSHDRCRPAP